MFRTFNEFPTHNLNVIVRSSLAIHYRFSKLYNTHLVARLPPDTSFDHYDIVFFNVCTNRMCDSIPPSGDRMDNT